MCRIKWIPQVCLLLWVAWIPELHSQIITQLPWICNFEVDLCGFVHDVSNPQNFAWTKHLGETKSQNTGPVASDGQGHYIYMEASHQNPGDFTSLRSPQLSLQNTDSCLTFKYNVHGMHIGKLEVLVYTNPLQTVWEYIGDWETDRFNFPWHTARVTVPKDATGFCFKAVRGGTWKGEPFGDICVDDVRLDYGPCEASPTVDNTWPDSNLLQVVPYALPNTENTNCPIVRTLQLCTFDGLRELTTDCLFHNSDVVKWRQQSGQTPTAQTGPLADFSKQSQGKYLYVEADGASSASVAKLTSPELGSLGGPFCLRFAYHMKGQNIGRLSVERWSGNVQEEVWAIAGPQGDNWAVSQVTLGEGTTKVSFVVIMGNGVQGDIAVDAIKLQYGSCAVVESCEMGPSTSPLNKNSTDLLECPFGPMTFQSDLCDGQSTGTSQFKWLLNRGSTPSANTGPDVDHTLSSPLGYYLYIEVSGFPNFEEARYRTKAFPVNVNGEPYCLRFWYHMYGSQMGAVSVLAHTVLGDTELWKSQQTNLGNTWLEKMLDVPADTMYLVFVGTKQPGVVDQGDIAIDDVSVIRKPCTAALPTPAIPTTPNNQWPGLPSDSAWPGPSANPSQNILGPQDYPPQSPNTICPVVKLVQDCKFDGATQLVPGCKHYNTGSGGLMWLHSLSPGLQNPTKYIYLKEDAQVGRFAELASPDLSNIGGPFCLSFTIQFTGSSPAMLRIMREAPQSTPVQIDQITNTGAPWAPYRKTISEFVSRITLQAAKTAAGLGGVAIDNLLLVYGSCEMIDTCTQASPNRDVQDSDSVQNCNMEANAFASCDLTPVPGPFKWVKHRGSTPTELTGPMVDKTLGNDQGYYYYTEVTGHPGGEKARMSIPVSSPGGSTKYCLRFWYHMYGADMGTLRVFADSPLGEKQVFSHSGSIDSNWHQANVTVEQLTSKLIFEGETKAGATRFESRGDMAVDDIEVDRGDCVQDNDVDITTGFEPCENRGSSLFSCGFDGTDQAICNSLTEMPQEAQSTWTRTNIPVVQFTLHRNGPKEYYMFMDSRLPLQNRAVLQVPLQSNLQGPYSLTFWYNLFDSQAGYISVCEVTSSNQLIELITVTASAATVGNNWNLKTVPVSDGTQHILFNSSLQQQTPVSGRTFGVGIDAISLNSSCEGFSSPIMQEQQVCTQTPCEKNKHLCNQKCENKVNWQTTDDYECVCLPGFALNQTQLCADIDECVSNPCGAQENCYNAVGSFVCVPGKCRKPITA